jgi:hypothetical protein
MRIVVCNRCAANWPPGGHTCKLSPLAKPTVLEDHSEMLELIRADIWELKQRLAPFLAMGLPKGEQVFKDPKADGK